jgi:hypothetical protein
MVMTRHMCAVRETQEQKRRARTPEQRRRRRQVLLECLDMLRDGALKFQKDLDDAHTIYERNMDAILKQSRTTRAVRVGAHNADAHSATLAASGGSGPSAADAQGVGVAGDNQGMK